MTTLREAAQQALEVLDEYAPQHGRPDDMMSAITALRAAFAQPSARQVSPAAFAEIVKGREEIVGVPVYWAQWPTEVKK